MAILVAKVPNGTQKKISGEKMPTCEIQVCIMFKCIQSGDKYSECAVTLSLSSEQLRELNLKFNLKESYYRHDSNSFKFDTAVFSFIPFASHEFLQRLKVTIHEMFGT